MVLEDSEDNIIDWNHVLDVACYRNDHQRLSVAISNGATNWNRGLAAACNGGNYELALLMIEKGANNFNNGLISACRAGSYKLTLLMIEKGANTWNLGLNAACMKGDYKLVQLMLKNGATDVDRALSSIMIWHPDVYRKNISRTIDIRNINSIVLMLIKCGANIDIQIIGLYLNITEDDIIWLIRSGVTKFRSFKHMAQSCREVISKQKHIMNAYLIQDLTCIVSQY